LLWKNIVLIESVTLRGFRCFCPEPTTVSVAPDITAIIGANAAGKTSLLQGLAKLFGVSRAQRTIHKSDFYLAPDTDPEGDETKEMFIDVLVGLPELTDGTATPETIAPSFRHMRLERVGDVPVCRLRLEARWEADGTVDGEVSQELFWVDTLNENPTDDQKHPVTAADRGLIQLYYTPASRDATVQVRDTTGALAARLLRAIEWSPNTQEAVKKASENLAKAFGGEGAIAAFCKALEARWSDLHDEMVDTKPRLSLGPVTK
jgi:putative ATP-dependent endonuclease of OLD family